MSLPPIRGFTGPWAGLASHTLRCAVDDTECDSFDRARALLKTVDPTRRAALMRMPTPKAALLATRRAMNFPLREDYQVVEPTLTDKLLNTAVNLNPGFVALLLSTGDAELINAPLPGEHSDDIFSVGRRGTGRNLYGRGLMSLRERLRKDISGIGAAADDPRRFPAPAAAAAATVTAAGFAAAAAEGTPRSTPMPQPTAATTPPAAVTGATVGVRPRAATPVGSPPTVTEDTPAAQSPECLPTAKPQRVFVHAAETSGRGEAPQRQPASKASRKRAARQDAAAAAAAAKRARMEAAARGASITVTPGDRYGAGLGRAERSGRHAAAAAAAADSGAPKPCRWFTGGQGSTDCTTLGTTGTPCQFEHSEKIARANLRRLGARHAREADTAPPSSRSPPTPPRDTTAGWLVDFDFTKGFGFLRPNGAASVVGTSAKPRQKSDVFFHRTNWTGKPSTFPVRAADLPVAVRYKESPSDRHPGRWAATSVSRR